MRHVASLLFRWLTDAQGHCVRDRSRRHEAEFPAATQIADQRLFLGSRAADRASTDALRPNNNWVELEDTHDISIIGEKWPASARRLPQKGRQQSPALSERALPGAGEEIIGAATGSSRRRTSSQNGPAALTTQRAPKVWVVPVSSSRKARPMTQPSVSFTRPVTQAARSNGFESSRPSSSRKPESIEVTTPRLYVGNLSFDATESDLFELFNGVGAVQNAEVVTYKHNQRSKGFAFVQMLTVDEAKRAVEELHDKEFLGRKLVVSGAKSSEHHSAN